MVEPNTTNEQMLQLLKQAQELQTKNLGVVCIEIMVYKTQIVLRNQDVQERYGYDSDYYDKCHFYFYLWRSHEWNIQQLDKFKESILSCGGKI